MIKQELVPEFDGRFDKDPDHKDRFDHLFDEDLLESLITEDQVHEMYIQYLMKRLESCVYGEFNGTPVIGLHKIKWAFEQDMRMLNMSSEYEGYDLIKATSKTGDSYLFYVAPGTYKGALDRISERYK